MSDLFFAIIAIIGALTMAGIYSLAGTTLFLIGFMGLLVKE